MLQGPTTQKTAVQHPDRFWMSNYFDDPIYSNGILMWDHFHYLPYQIIFPSICGSSKTEFGYVLGVHFIVDWSSWPRQTRTRIGLGLWLGLDVLAGLLRWWPRRRTSKGFLGGFSKSLGCAPTWARVPRMNNKPITIM